MEIRVRQAAAEAQKSLCPLSEEDRLDIFRVLVHRSPAGVAKGAVTRHCGLPGAACSFHLKELERGGLVRCCRHGRSQVYTVNFRAIQALLSHLTEHCCSEEECDYQESTLPKAARF